jgi:hypothetical protein
MESPRQILATTLLGRPVTEYIAEHRANRMSWRKLARKLEDDTNGLVVVTPETLRAWSE